jgi:Tol biopolymer transport system component
MRRKRMCTVFVLVVVSLTIGAGCSLPGNASAFPSSQDPDMFLAETRSDGAMRLTTPPSGASDQNPAFSPDGLRLVFTRFDNGYNVGPAGLFLLGVSGGTTARLTPWEDQDNVNLPGAAWDGGSDRIVFSSDRAEADDLWRIAPDTTDFTRVTTHTSLLQYIEPSWSPDGQWIAFEGSQSGGSEDGRVGQVYKVRADGSGATLLTDGTDDDRQPNWSPVGNQILFQRRSLPDGQWDIYTIHPDGSGLQNVTNTPGVDETDASWSPDGTYIVYSTDDGSLPAPSIYIIPAVGGSPVRVTSSGTAEDSAPSWSPDGRWIAFESRPSPSESTPASLWRIAVPSSVYLPLALRNATSAPSSWWRPSVNTTWQWQLGNLPIDQSFAVDMYDIDMFDNDASTVAALRAQGRMVICYISVGSWEDWRPDAADFPSSVLGNDYQGWPGEKWLDVRQIDLLAPIMRTRFDQCQAKGFDGIEPDNIDGYTNNTGFPLSYQDQLNYNIWLVNEAHARGLSIGLKNDDEQASDLLPYFDWAMTEDCFADDWCSEMMPFTSSGKAVFAAEYTDMMTENKFLDIVCPQAQALQFSAILKNRDLDAWRQACP